MRDIAIYKIYPSVTNIIGDGIPRNVDGAEVVIDEAVVANEVTRLQAEYDSDYARKRQEEYPSLLELTVALYDTDDKSAVESKRASVKAKYPKPA